MLFIVAISIALILIIVLFYKFIGVDRGVDKYKENVNETKTKLYFFL